MNITAERVDGNNVVRFPVSVTCLDNEVNVEMLERRGSLSNTSVRSLGGMGNVCEREKTGEGLSENV